MAVPKRKTSPSKRNQRRSHLALKPLNIAVDQQSGENRLQHHVSKIDGFYRGKQMVVSKPKVLATAEATA